MLKYLAASAALLLAMPALAQVPPTGTQVLNQVGYFAAITPSDATVFPFTKGIYIGHASACNVSIVGAKGGGTVVISNLQPGLTYPFSIISLNATGTTCTGIIGLW
jgi:hypothetical protein